MKRLAIFTLLYICVCYCCAQKYRYPVFDRTDEPRLHIDSVEFTKDSTFLYFTYEAEGNSWAQISGCTYLEELTTGMRYKILDAKGIPFNPSRRRFEAPSTIKVVLCFPPTKRTIFNLIEDENEKAFNIYGIDLSSSYSKSYSIEDINYHFRASHEKLAEGDWKSAIGHTLQQLEASNYIEGIHSFASACSMYNLTLIYHGSNEYENVIEWGKRAIDILRVLPQDSLILDVLSRTYGNIGTAYHMIKKHEMGQQYQELSLAVRRNGSEIGTVPYEEYLRQMAYDYYYENNYPKALLYKREYVDLIESKYKEDSLTWGCAYVEALGELSEFYQRLDKVEEAIICSNKALELINSGICIDSIWVKDLVRINLAGALATNGNTEEAISILKEVSHNTNIERVAINSRMLLADLLLECKQDTINAINEFLNVLSFIENEKIFNRFYHGEHSEILNKLYRAYRDVNPDKARDYLRKAIQLQEKWNGDESVAYANACLRYLNDIFLHSLTGSKDERDSLLIYLRQASNILKRHLCNSIYNMSKEERAFYWQNYSYIYTWLIPTASSFMDGIDDASSMAYESALFYKGMLLSSEKEFKDIVLSSQDNSLIELYKNYVNNLSILEEQYEQTHSKTTIDSLKDIIHNQEYLLSLKATRFNKQYNGTNVSWKDVKNKLHDGDVAIEFISYPNINATGTLYDAYIIDNKSTSPIIVPLFDDEDLSNCFNQDAIDYDRLANLIWRNKHVYTAIKDKKNIYFSAAGQLNSIGIEYLPFENGQYISDLFNLYRLSSTREICYDNAPNKTNRVCLFGGLNYEYTTSRPSNENGQVLHVSRAVADSIAYRGGFDPLFGSEQEVMEIQKVLTHNNIMCFVYSGSEGTEDDFKKLSSSYFDVIHISTHGMYVPIENTLEGHQHFGFIISAEEPTVDEESVALSRSFLVMSGGNKLLRQEGMAEGEEDNILTALEISHLDFSNLNLVVLSACQTALGVIDSDGVYGLQRAFKKAGAQTILMSLDKVDDEATKILMIEFYKNLMSGKTKLQSLREAQKYLRKVEGGKYDEPKYWASFILLDGLD